MSLLRKVNDSVHWYMQDLASRIVADSGIPSDRYHLGKLILQSLKDSRDFLLQIDGATGKSETCGSVLERSVRCAVSMHNAGLSPGDVVVLMAPNHLDVTIPLYGALYQGFVVVAVDMTLDRYQMEQVFSITKPSIIFCEGEIASDIEVSLLKPNVNSLIISFEEEEDFCNFPDFLGMYDDDTPTEDFTCYDLDPEESLAFLAIRSGIAGLPKAAAHTHKYFASFLAYMWIQHTTFPTPTRLALVGSPLHWFTAMTSFIRSPILRYTRLQTSAAMTQEHVCYLLSRYKPTYALLSPTLVTRLLMPDNQYQCDFSSFELLMLSGVTVPQKLIENVQAVSPHTEVLNIFATSELAGPAFYGDNPAPGSCGKPLACFQYRIINNETYEEIYEVNEPGELWIKGLCPFKGYYNNMLATSESYTPDGWLRTGDLFYRDENWNFFYVDRMKLQLMCFNTRLSPLEIERVILKHPDVFDVAVISVPHKEWGNLPVACIVPQPGAQPSAMEIKNMVKESLQEGQQFEGVVIFIDSMPMTATTKVDRRKLQEMALVLPRA